LITSNQGDEIKKGENWAEQGIWNERHGDYKKDLRNVELKREKREIFASVTRVVLQKGLCIGNLTDLCSVC